MILKGKRIFIIEDDLVNKAITQMLLEQEGARTSCDRWGTEAISRLRSFMPVDAILLDLMFPRSVSGFDIFAQIRANPEFDEIPVIAVSAGDTSTALPKAQAFGFSGYIAKPVDYQNFASQVLDIIQGGSVWESGRRLRG